MADVAEKRVGSGTYRVYGLQGRAESIRATTRRLSEATSTRLDAARTAIADWRGPHAVAFVERVNGVLSGMVSLQLAGEGAASRCSSFPDEPYVSSMVSEYAYRGARVYDTPSSDGTVSAVPADLHGYAGAVADQGGRFTGVASEVTTEGLSADVSVLRPLTAEERSEWEENGVPRFEIETASVWGDPQPVAVTEVFGLPDLSGQAAALGSEAEELSVWVSAVAYAFEQADSGLLRLLLEHPELAGYLDRVALTDGRMTGEAALMIVLANLDRFDMAAGRGGDDDIVGVPDLETIANDPNAPAHLRAAAEYLLANRLLLSQASIVDDPLSYEIEPEEGSLTPAGITLFLEYNAALRAVGLDFDRLDTAAHGGEPDGEVSVNDLRAAADDESLPPDLRDAASFLLANGMLTQRLAFYDRANLDRMTYSTGGQFQLTDGPVEFTHDALIALAVDQQAFASDPDAAHRFVLGLPMADRDGHGGLPITLTSDEGVRALANAALLDARFDLSEQNAVIAHLPETTGWGSERGAVEQAGGVRNTLINGFYDLLAHRADELFAGPELAGHPDVPGHPGANWLMFAPWASNSVHGAITGDTTGPLGFSTSGIMQAAADGNQWIFNDIGGRFSAFLEMYEHNPRPTEAELERFFANSFDEGDGTIRTGFAAYVAAVEEDDPVRKQQLLFQGNTLVATHEQAGAQPYLEDMSLGPDGIAVRFFPDIQVGNAMLHVSRDIPARDTPNNHIVVAPLLSLDTGGRSADSFAGDQTWFQTGEGSTTGVVDLAPMAGIESFRPGFSPSTTVWFEEGAGDSTDPESLEGSGASSWPDWEERMYSILRLFEQFHTEPTLFNTDRIDASFEHVEWLDDGARPGG